MMCATIELLTVQLPAESERKPEDRAGGVDTKIVLPCECIFIINIVFWIILALFIRIVTSSLGVALK